MVDGTLSHVRTVQVMVCFLLVGREKSHSGRKELRSSIYCDHQVAACLAVVVVVVSI